MSALLRGLVQKGSSVARTAAAVPKASLVSGPPRYRVSAAEQFILGAVMLVVVCTPAAYFMANIKNYKKG